MATRSKPGLLVLLSSGPDSAAERARALEATRLLETLAGLEELPLKLLLIGRAGDWLAKPALPAEGEGPAAEHEEQTEAVEEFLESLEVMAGLRVGLGICMVTARRSNIELAAAEQGLNLQAYPQQVARALKENWRIITF